MNKIQSLAKSKYVRQSTHKISRVLKQIKGQNYNEATLNLEFMPYKACKIVNKTLQSAFYNMNPQNIKNLNKNQIVIKSAFADKGPTLKRFQPRAQGRAFPIHKPTCHITIKLEISS